MWAMKMFEIIWLGNNLTNGNRKKEHKNNNGGGVKEERHRNNINNLHTSSLRFNIPRKITQTTTTTDIKM